MQKRDLFKFRVRSLYEGRSTFFGVILSWSNGVIDIMDQDLKRRTIPESRIVKIERVGTRIEPPTTTQVDDSAEQIELFPIA